jgi:hypothetical protein
MGMKEVQQKAQFVQNILRKEKHLAGPKRDRPDLEAGRRFRKAKREKAGGGAKVAKTPKSATPRETILGSRPRVKRA